MPIPIISEGLFEGFDSVPYLPTVLKTVPALLLVYLLKRYFGGAVNKSERLMRSKVVMITGGTSGVGASVARELAQRGAQVILLTQHPPSDPFLAEYIEDLRATTNNELVYAEQVDLSSLHSIRLFATKWVDNAPPRRLDMIILCAATMTPPRSKPEVTKDGLEASWGINYLANFHLLSILSPALRAQPPDRDVRVIFGTCSSYMGGNIDQKVKKQKYASTNVYGTSKLALMVFAQAFQKHLEAYKRPDSQPNNTRVVLADPGWSRTPGMRRWLTAGSLWGLFFYLIMWPFWWLVLKSPDQGAQSFLLAAMEADLGRGAGGRMIKECRDIAYVRPEIKDDNAAKDLWALSEKQIETLEKEGAIKRTQEKKEKEKREKTEKATTDGGLQSENRADQSRKAGSRRSRKAA
ncbi:NAD(P)-binding protein [Xylona heveae TC161]|uniref:NAD(P)-binding protein n=1 Tax=Xylona heveae (strain CBS 132557 / TC161) TaxID=1328760 RepID=A0A165HB92_XYLHT|nr:NAD(P)-binding protein [Xylona heveae TC161]KZF23246.1 NAD(P)-binding protein [Xylona heveae TC161]